MDVVTWVPLADQSEPEDEAREYAPLAPPDNAPPLIRAASAGDLQTVRRELDAGFDPNFEGPNSRSMSAIEWVCHRSGTSKNYRYADSPAEERDRVAIVEALFDAGVSPLQLSSGSSAFSYAHKAAYYDRPQILATIIKAAGADATALVNRRNRGNWTAMHFAVREGSIEMVQMLLRAGASVHPRNGMGHTALEEAVYNRKRRLYPLLLAAGAEITGILRANDAYLRKVATMGFPRYEKAHRTRLTATCARVVFPRLPVDAVSHVVAFAFHVGYY